MKGKKGKSNVELGNIITLDTENTNIYNDSQKYLIATLGVNNLNIVNCNNVILIANREHMNELPKMIEKIKKIDDLNKYL